MLANNVSLKELIDTYALIDNKVIDRGGAQTVTPSTTNRVLPKGNYKGDITIKGDANLIAKNIKEGTSIFGVNGSLREFPPGWDIMKSGEVFGGNINKNDAVIWKRYGNWDTQLDMVKDFNLPEFTGTFMQSLMTEDGKYLVAMSSSSPYLHMYKNVNDTFIKMPNPDVVPTRSSQCSLAFSKDGSLLFLCTNEKKMYCYKNENGILTSMPAPVAENSRDNPSFYSVTINSDATVIGVHCSLANDSSYSYVSYIFTREKGTFNYKQVFRLGDNSYGYKLVSNPSGTCITVLHEGNYIPFFYLQTDGTYNFGTDMKIKGVTSIEWIDDKNLVLLNGDGTAKKCTFDPLGQLSNMVIKSTITCPSGYTINGCALSVDGLHYALSLRKGSGYSTFAIYMYKINGDSFTKINEIACDYQVLAVRLPQDYCIIESTVAPHLYRTTSKDIVIPLDQLYKDTLMTKEIGVAMDAGVVGQNIRVNTFPKLKL